MVARGNAELDHTNLPQMEPDHLANILVADYSRIADVPLEFSQMAVSSKSKTVKLLRKFDKIKCRLISL